MRRFGIGIAVLVALATCFALGSVTSHWLGGKRLSAEAMGASVREGLREPGLLERVTKLSEALAHLDAENREAAVLAYEERLERVTRTELMLLAESWARLDAPGAFAYVSGWSDPNKRLHGIVAVSYAWGRRDPTAARRALDEIRDPNVLGEAIPALARGWVRSGVPGVSDFVAGLPKGQFRQLVTIALIGEIIKRDGRAAVANWAESLPNDSPAQFKKTAFRKVAGLMAHKDPPATAAWVERHAGWSYAEGTTKIVAMRWADVDPPASLTWLSTRPPGPERETAVSAAASRWLERDLPAAEEWIGQRADEAWLNPGQDTLARRLASTAPARAAALGVRIQDAKRRRKCLAFILGHWLEQEPEDARAWLETSALAEEDRRAVLEASEARHRSGTRPGES